MLSTNVQSVSQGLFEESSVQQMDLGAKVISNDGSEFRYVKAGAANLVPGTLQQAPAIVANHQNMTCTAAAIGAKQVTVTLGNTAATANQYAGGIFEVNDETGQGQTYRVASHPAAVGSATLVVTLEDALVIAVDGTSQASLIPNLYNGVIINPTTPTNVPVGVAVYPITAGYYGFIKTKGAVACLNDGNTAVGLGVSPSQGTAGAVKTMAATLHQVGSALQAGVTTEYNTIFVNL